MPRQRSPRISASPQAAPQPAPTAGCLLPRSRAAAGTGAGPCGLPGAASGNGRLPSRRTQASRRYQDTPALRGPGVAQHEIGRDDLAAPPGRGQPVGRGQAAQEEGGDELTRPNSGTPRPAKRRVGRRRGRTLLARGSGIPPWPGLVPQPRWAFPTIADQHGCVFTADGQFHCRLAGIRGLKPAWFQDPAGNNDGFTSGAGSLVGHRNLSRGPIYAE